MTSDASLAFAHIGDLGRLLREGQTTAVALTALALERLETIGRQLNAVVTTTPDIALAQAERADSELAAGIDRGPLHGIPYGAKDLLATDRYPTTWGAAPFREQVFTRDAAVVTRLEDAGAVLVAKLAMVDMPCVDVPARPFFRDVYDHARRAASRAKGLNETLGSIVEMAGLLEQSRQSRTTRQLAAWAAILAVPTAIAGIYGMNFDFMPELQWRYGYFVVLGVTATVCLALYVRFHRIGWL